MFTWAEDHYLHLWTSALLIQRHFNRWWWGRCLCFIKPPLSGACICERAPNIKTLNSPKREPLRWRQLKHGNTHLSICSCLSNWSHFFSLVRKAICQRKQMVHHFMFLFKTYGFLFLWVYSPEDSGTWEDRVKEFDYQNIYTAEVSLTVVSVEDFGMIEAFLLDFCLLQWYT